MIYLAIIISYIKIFYYHSLILVLAIFVFKAGKSEIPGPFLGKLTSLYSSYYIFKGQLHTKLHQLHLQYGPTVQFAPNLVSLINREDINQLYNNNKYIRSQIYTAFRAGGESLGHLIDKNKHLNRKKIIKKVYNSKNMPELEEMIINSGTLPLLKKLTEKTKQNEIFDLHDLIHLANFDIIGTIGFGKYLNAINNQKYDIAMWINDFMLYSLSTFTFPIIEYFGIFFGKKGSDDFFNFCKDLIEEEKNSVSGKKQLSVLHTLQESKDYETGNHLTDNDIQAEMMLQLIAGIDTVTNTAVWAIKTLLKNPDIMEIVISELDAAFSKDDRDITANAIKNKCPYLEAVLFETMRMYSPTLSFVPRVIPKEGTYFSGYYLSPGMECSYSAFAYHRSPLHWDNPDVFNPERFMGPEGIKLRSKVLVFLLGPTVCPGREVAWLNLFLTTANILRNFSISTKNLNFSFEYSSFMVKRPTIISLPVKVSIRNN